MKKFSLLFLSALALLFTSCNEAEYELHNTHFEYPRLNHMEFYADQEYDSLVVFSFDPWTAITEGDSAWFTHSPQSGEARPGTSATTRIDIKMPQNTTGHNRKNAIVVKSHFDIRMPIYQCSWLNIGRPAPILNNKESYTNQTVFFEMNLAAENTSEQIHFHVYQDNATLTLDNYFVSFTGANEGKTTMTFNKGTHTVPLKIQKNEDHFERQTKLILTSGEISTPIHIKQAGKKKDNKEEK